ncbi:MAG TPA: histidine kinase [Bryobacteraceae bacterium]|jgi:signal transduction histidine kinase|nr:histidine kinase [Bryobacteraceae bacterium]
MPTAAHLLKLHDRERRELCRELHANAAQQIAALQLKLELLMQGNSPLPPKAAQVLAECCSIAGECAREIRRICYSLHPPLLDEMGLAAALRSRPEVRKIAAHLPESLPRLSPEREIAIFRMIEEALPRISRLSLTRKGRSLIVELDLPALPEAIRGRIRGLQGRVTMTPGGVRITLPIQPTAEES